LGLEAGAAALKEITLSREIDPELPPVTLDYVQVGRIVTNLVNNAIKYTEAHGTIEIRTRHDAELVHVEVRDSGPGMTAEQCRELFAPYRRVQLHGYTPGTGLGLYIVKRLTEAQGGRVAVDSTVGVGSTFVVSFPRLPMRSETSGRDRRRTGATLQASGRLVPRPAPVRAA
jgi:signal transduction histidine kinase